MRNFQLALLCFICIAKSYGQTAARNYGKIVVETTKEKKPKKVYTKVEIKSAFFGGDSSWVQSIVKQLNQSIRLDKGVKKGKYFVSVQFIVDRDSILSDVVCLQDPGFGMCREVLSIVKRSQPWRPAGRSYPVRQLSRSSTTTQDE